jgi:large subunit ribosomal protein L16
MTNQKIIKVKSKNKTIFVPPELSFKKMHKGLIPVQIYKQNLTNLGFFPIGIKALESARITPKQNESLRRVLGKKFKNIIIYTNHSLIPSVPITKKAMGIRMGKGKGAVSYWINKLSAAKISLYITIPNVLDNLKFWRYNYSSISKRFNYNSKIIINTHFMQEKYNSTEKKIYY